MADKDPSKNSRFYEQRTYGNVPQKNLRDPNNGGKGKKPGSMIIVVMAAFMILVFGVMIYILVSGNSEKKPGKGKTTGAPVTSGATVTSSPSENPAGYEYFAVVLAVDPEVKQIKIYDIDEQVEMQLVYTGSSLFYARLGSLITGAQLSPGDIVRIKCDSRNVITKAVWADDTWEKLKVDDLEIIPEENRMVIRGQNYKYSDDICILSDGVKVPISSLLTKEDKYTIRGLGTEVFEIIVTMGHGTIKLKNFDDFIGGTIMIGSRYYKDITPDGVFTVREGEYQVTVENKNYKGTETLTVKRDSETVFDVFDYGRGNIFTGEVYFTIEPEGASLYVNGKKTDYADAPVTLDYGNYDLEIEAGGYETQTTTLRVDREKQYITIYLTLAGDVTPTPVPTGETSDNPDVTPTVTVTPTPIVQGGTFEHADISNMGFKIDKDHVIYILGPEGAEVMLTNPDDGNTYVAGNAPCEFSKVIGSMQILITYKGQVSIFDYYETDDGTDSYYNFSDRFSN